MNGEEEEEEEGGDTGLTRCFILFPLICLCRWLRCWEGHSRMMARAGAIELAGISRRPAETHTLKQSCTSKAFHSPETICSR